MEHRIATRDEWQGCDQIAQLESVQNCRSQSLSYTGDSRGGIIDEWKYTQALGQQEPALVVVESAGGVFDDWLQNLQSLLGSQFTAAEENALQSWTRPSAIRRTSDESRATLSVTFTACGWPRI